MFINRKTGLLKPVLPSRKIGRRLLYPFLLMLLLITLAGNQAKICADPNNDPVAQATELYYRGRFTEALIMLRRSVATQPENDQARLNLVRLLKESGKQQEALTYLNHLIQKEPANVRYRSVLAETAYLAGNPGSVVEHIFPDEADPQTLYWQGLAFADLGKNEAAQESLIQSIKKQPNNPMAYYALGLLEQKMNNYQNAFARFQQALSQEPKLSRSYFPLAKNYIGSRMYKTSYNLLAKAESTEPWTFPLDFDFLTSDESESVVATELAEEPVKISEMVPPQVNPIIENRETIPEIRIGLVSKIQRLRVKTGGGFQLMVKGGRSITGSAGEILLFVRTSQGVEVYDCKGNYLLKSWQAITLSYDDPGATSLIFDAKFRSSYWSKGQPRIYRGMLELLPKSVGMTVINHVNLEEYLYSVVPSEIPASWPTAVLEAQAVAARTYALANLGRYKIQGFDLLATPASQVYNGVTQEAPSVIAAVDATRGRIITYEGKPAGAFYYDNSGGYTESGAFVWGTDKPYLQALPEKPMPVRDQPLPPDDLAAWLTSQPECNTFREGYYVRSAYRWTLWVSSDQLEARIRSQAKVGRIKSIITMERGISGRVKRVMVKGTAGSYIIDSKSIQYRLGGLRSNLFVVQPKLGRDGLPESFIFHGGGWGHGVGMSQSGAAGMALEGATYSEILAYYYPGTELSQQYCSSLSSSENN